MTADLSKWMLIFSVVHSGALMTFKASDLKKEKPQDTLCISRVGNSYKKLVSV